MPSLASAAGRLQEWWSEHVNELIEFTASKAALEGERCLPADLFPAPARGGVPGKMPGAVASFFTETWLAGYLPSPEGKSPGQEAAKGFAASLGLSWLCGGLGNCSFT